MPPRLYDDLAHWWPLFSDPADYAGEAEWILDALAEALGRPPATLLELGSGGGNTASHLTRHTRPTLVELAPAMIETSRRINPNTEHIEGDMRRVRLGRTFEAVLIHDAIMYMTTLDDLVAALATAHAHLGRDGVVMAVPDYVAETFEPHTEMGGRDASDGGGRGLRYIEWTHAPAAGASVHQVDYAIMLRDLSGTVEHVFDRHRLGLFTRQAWQGAFVSAGLQPSTMRADPWRREVFIARA